MKIVLFIEGEADHRKWPSVTLDHLTAHLNASHCCYSDGQCGDDIQLDFHQFTPAHARQLIEILTPIAAQDAEIAAPAAQEVPSAS